MADFFKYLKPGFRFCLLSVIFFVLLSVSAGAQPSHDLEDSAIGYKYPKLETVWYRIDSGSGPRLTLNVGDRILIVTVQSIPAAGDLKVESPRTNLDDTRSDTWWTVRDDAGNALLLSLAADYHYTLNSNKWDNLPVKIRFTYTVTTAPVFLRLVIKRATGGRDLSCLNSPVGCL